MSNSDKYENLYRERRGICGEPFSEIAGFFESYGSEKARILDLGCGQGRDSLMVARHGHSVLGIDSSPTGIQQMLEDAGAEGLSVEGVVSDLADYKIGGTYDVIILDRVLHILEEDLRIALLEQALQHVSPDGLVLIADMPSNKPALRAAFCQDPKKWSAVLDRKGFLFMRQEADSHPSPHDH